MSFVISGLVVVVTLAWAVLQTGAAAMSDVPGAESGAGWTLVVGLTVAGLIAGSHWLPPISW